MLTLYLTLGMIGFGIVVYIYGLITEQRGHNPQLKTVKNTGRDMWMNSLLECYYEPAKYVFGPGKAIPAKKTDSDRE